MQNMPVHVSHDSLVAILEDILTHVRAGDSFEGNLEYLCPDPDEAPGDTEETMWMEGFMVRAAYRIGNLQGQGSMRMIGDMR